MLKAKLRTYGPVNQEVPMLQGDRIKLAVETTQGGDIIELTLTQDNFDSQTVTIKMTGKDTDEGLRLGTVRRILFWGEVHFERQPEAHGPVYDDAVNEPPASEGER